MISLILSLRQLFPKLCRLDSSLVWFLTPHQGWETQTQEGHDQSCLKISGCIRQTRECSLPPRSTIHCPQKPNFTFSSEVNRINQTGKYNVTLFEITFRTWYCICILLHENGRNRRYFSMRAQRVLEMSLVMTVLVCYYNRNLKNIKNVRLPQNQTNSYFSPST
jgi:hypothetical protein